MSSFQNTQTALGVVISIDRRYLSPKIIYKEKPIPTTCGDCEYAFEQGCGYDCYVCDIDAGNSMNTIDRQRLKKLADRKVERELRPCRHCGNKNFNWDFILMIKTCKNNKCNDVSGVI